MVMIKKQGFGFVARDLDFLKSRLKKEKKQEEETRKKKKKKRRKKKKSKGVTLTFEKVGLRSM